MTQTGRLLANDGADLVRRALPTALPWVRFLPAEGVDTLAAEFVETVRASAAVNTVAAVSQLLAEWRHTAEVYADPALIAVLRARHDGDFGPVLAPDLAD